MRIYIPFSVNIHIIYYLLGLSYNRTTTKEYIMGDVKTIAEVINADAQTIRSHAQIASDSVGSYAHYNEGPPAKVLEAVKDCIAEIRRVADRLGREIESHLNNKQQGGQND